MTDASKEVGDGDGRQKRKRVSGKDPKHAPKILSHIHPLHLEESIGGAQGEHASVSILDPVLRVERSHPVGPASNPRATYRIILHFVVQFAINNFDRKLTDRHNRIFDSITIRYLYRHGERHIILPPGDAIASDIQVTNEAGVTGDVQLGLSAINGQPSPSVVVHAQNESKVTYERKLRSWRKGLSYEPYPPPTPPHKPRSSLTPLLGLIGIAPPHRHHHHHHHPEAFFRVSSLHTPDCCCRPAPDGPQPDWCHYRHTHKRPYDRAAHWSGQTEAQLHLWTPEIYENVNIPITIGREVDARELDRILGGASAAGQQQPPASRRDVNLLRRALHFDFDVETRLREIGWRFRDLFTPASQPAELRARSDAGCPLPPDRARFCISACVEAVHWPARETRNLQREAEEQTARQGHLRQLPTAEEYEALHNGGGGGGGGDGAGPLSAVGSVSGSGRGRRVSWSCHHHADGSPRAPSRGRQSRDSGYASNGADSPGEPACRGRKRVSFSPDNRLRTFRPGRRSRSQNRSPVRAPRPRSPSLPLSEYLDIPSSEDGHSIPSRSRSTQIRTTYRMDIEDSLPTGGSVFPPLPAGPVLTHRERRARSRRASLDMSTATNPRRSQSSRPRSWQLWDAPGLDDG